MYRRVVRCLYFSRGMHCMPGLVKKLQQDVPEREARHVLPSAVAPRARPPRLPPGGTP